MKNRFLGIFSLIFSSLWISAGELQIEWIDSDNFRDAEYYHNGGDRSTQRVLNNLDRFFSKETRRFFEEGVVLEMKVTQLDLAGDFEPWHGTAGHDVRIVRSIYPAYITFEYRLLGENGEVLQEGEEKLSDRLMGQSMASQFLSRSESYPYVKSLVRDWMRKLARKVES